MEYSLGLLAVWIILFAPVGLAFHAAVLGASARRQAAPLAPLTGIAIATIVLVCLRQAGISAGASWLAIAAVVASVASCLVIWRRGGSWRGRHLIGATTLLLLAVLLMQIPAFQAISSGPLGYGSTFDPIPDIARIDRAAGGAGQDTGALRALAGQRADHPDGFEQLAAFTVSIGDTGNPRDSWSGYTLFTPLAGLLLAMTILPLFVLARWRGIGWFGLIFVLLLGVTSAPALLALTAAQGAVLAGVPLIMCAITAVMLMRRDFGWVSIAVVAAGASVAVVGALALVPIGAVAAAWMYLQRTSHEHLAHTDTPTQAWRPRLAIVLTVMFSLYGTMRVISSGQWLTGEPLQSSFANAMRGWPYSWIGVDLRPHVPSGWQDSALVALGLIVVVGAITRLIVTRDRQELALVSAPIVLVFTACVTSFAAPQLAIRIIDLAWLVAAPIVAVLLVRVVGQMRASGKDPVRERLQSAGVLLVVALFSLMSMASAGTSGSRGVHGPPRDPETLGAGRTLIAVDDPWMTYNVQGTVVRGDAGVVDADQLVAVRNRHLDGSILYDRYQHLILGTDPLSSDPPFGYTARDALLGYAVRVFEDAAPALDASAAATSKNGSAVSPVDERPRRHDPVELADPKAPTGIGGLLLPNRSFATCSLAAAAGICSVDEPAVSAQCSPADVKLARSARFTTKRQRERFPLLGVACWEVEVDDATQALRVHVRDVGVILSPLDAELDPPTGAWKSVDGSVTGPLYPGDSITSVGGGATASYGGEHLGGTYDFVLEGQVGAGTRFTADAGAGVGVSTTFERGFGGWTRIVAGIPVFGSVKLSSESGATVKLGRMFARPTDHDRACDIAIAPLAGASKELIVPRIGGGNSSAATAAPADDAEPGLTATVARISRPRKQGNRRATLVLGSYLQHLSAPRYTLVDWTEQFTMERAQSACTGFEIVSTRDGVAEEGTKPVATKSGLPFGESTQLQRTR